jgi:hypothetical protein
MCPWMLLKDSNSFASYLSAYSVFLSSICGVMISHFYYVSGRKLKVDDLYTMSSEGMYHYYHGFNLRAYAACTSLRVPPLPLSRLCFHSRLTSFSSSPPPRHLRHPHQRRRLFRRSRQHRPPRGNSQYVVSLFPLPRSRPSTSPLLLILLPAPSLPAFLFHRLHRLLQRLHRSLQDLPDPRSYAGGE